MTINDFQEYLTAFSDVPALTISENICVACLLTDKLKLGSIPVVSYLYINLISPETVAF